MSAESEHIQGVELSWRNVTFEVPLMRTEMKAAAREYREKQLEGKPPTHKVILSEVSGRLAPGSFTAIMGASGSGKTTLLNFLSNRRYYLKKIKVAGTVCLNGHERSELQLNRYVAYVMQDDVLIECMTVREILTFTAKLRLPEDKWEHRMMEVVEQLELAKIMNSRVGGVLSRGISGGERKRVAIAMEILSDPFVLFLDEPTTGLDSYNAENVISMCTRLCKMGKTVCCTIHQPNSFIFSLFENLIILADKKIVFNGSQNDAVEYFGKFGFTCPEFMNPAEHMIKVLSDKTAAAVFPAVNDSDPVEIRTLPERQEEARPSAFKQLSLLVQRSYTNFIRNRLMLRFKAMSKLFLIFVFLTAFWMVAGDQDFRSVGDRAGFLAFFLTSTSFDAVGSVGGYYDEKGQYVREQANHTYSPAIYYVSKLISELPMDIIMLVIFQASIYAGVGFSFEDAAQIFIFIFVNIIVFVNGKGWCFMLLFGFENMEISAAVMPLVMVLQMMFGGFFINFANIPKYLYEFEYISVFKYSWSALMINEFDTFDESKCGESPECDAVDFYSIELSLWGNVGVAIGITVVVNFLAYFILNRLSKAFRS